MNSAISNVKNFWRRFVPNWPLVVWMILISILLGIISGSTSQQLISQFSAGWGVAVGEFALILIPSFTLAAAIDHLNIKGQSPILVGMAPLAGAGMVCPDTAYASLSPTVTHWQLSLAFSSYAGFKLLFPAGPLIIAASLGVVADRALFGYSVAIFIPVWVAGILFARTIDRPAPSSEIKIFDKDSIRELSRLWPFALLAALLAAGVLSKHLSNPWIDFATNPKGALILTAASTLCMVHRSERRNCIESGVRRTGALLLVIGSASAFSAFLTTTFPVDELFAAHGGLFALFSLFSLGALFKLLQGSSMATFAVVGPLALPIVTASGIAPVFAVLAICLGSFIAILPNDSFYWLVRQHALPNHKEINAIAILGGGSVVQAAAGLAVLSAFYLIG